MSIDEKAAKRASLWCANKAREGKFIPNDYGVFDILEVYEAAKLTPRKKMTDDEYAADHVKWTRAHYGKESADKIEAIYAAGRAAKLSHQPEEPRAENASAAQENRAGRTKTHQPDELSYIEHLLDAYEVECIRFGQQKGYINTELLQAERKNVIKAITTAMMSQSAQPISASVTERCIADDQWAIDAFYDGYEKAQAAYKENGFSGLKPIIGGIRSLLAAINAPKQESQPDELPYQDNGLLPCPFCGGYGELDMHPTTANGTIKCADCHARALRTDWNKRHTIPMREVSDCMARMRTVLANCEGDYESALRAVNVLGADGLLIPSESGAAARIMREQRKKSLEHRLRQIDDVLSKIEDREGM